jgi:hypothetical protein
MPFDNIGAQPRGKKPYNSQNTSAREKWPMRGCRCWRSSNFLECELNDAPN